MYERIGLGSLANSPLRLIPELELWDKIVLMVYKSNDLLSVRLFIMEKRAQCVLMDYAAECFKFPRIYPSLNQVDHTTKWTVGLIRRQIALIETEWEHGARQLRKASSLTQDATWSKYPPVPPSAPTKPSAAEGEAYANMSLLDRQLRYIIE